MEKRVPLAERMRPSSLDDFFGQKHIVGENMLLRRAIKMGEVGSCIFYGPPGTGKTTLANIIANSLNGNFKKLNAVSSGVSDAKEIIDEARKNKTLFGKQTYLLLDECHRWSKSQSDCVLSAIEDGSIIFIGFYAISTHQGITATCYSTHHKEACQHQRCSLQLPSIHAFTPLLRAFYANILLKYIFT